MRVGYFEFNTLHSFRDTGRVDKKFESLETGSKRLRRLTAEPPGLRFLRFDDQEQVLQALGKRPWHDGVPSETVEQLKRRHAAFWTFMEVLQSAGLTKPVDTAALDLNSPGSSSKLGVYQNLTDSSAKLLFQPIPFAPAIYMAADQMMRGLLPQCPTALHWLAKRLGVLQG